MTLTNSNDLGRVIYKTQIQDHALRIIPYRAFTAATPTYMQDKNITVKILLGEIGV